jgi:hypothetical protein
MLRQWLIELVREAIRAELEDRTPVQQVATAARPEVKVQHRARTFLEWTDMVDKERR